MQEKSVFLLQVFLHYPLFTAKAVFQQMQIPPFQIPVKSSQAFALHTFTKQIISCSKYRTIHSTLLLLWMYCALTQSCFMLV